MKTHKIIQPVNTIYQSEVMPEVTTEDYNLGRVIQWADEHPHVWEIVTTTKSKAFGRKSCEYIGWARHSQDAAAILERLRRFCAIVRPDITRDDLAAIGHVIFRWKAVYTFRKFKAPGFTGGIFRRWDGQCDRDCMTLDYTPSDLPKVLRNFMEWSDERDAENRWKLNGVFIDDVVVDLALAREPDWDGVH